MSGMETEGLVHAAVASGADEYLSKPVTRKEAALMWRHVLRRRAGARPRVPSQGTTSSSLPSCAGQEASGNGGVSFVGPALEPEASAARDQLAGPLPSNGFKYGESRQHLPLARASLSSLQRHPSDTSRRVVVAAPAAGLAESQPQPDAETGRCSPAATKGDVLEVLHALRKTERAAALRLQRRLETVAEDLEAAREEAGRRRSQAVVEDATQASGPPAKRRAVHGSDPWREARDRAVPGSEIVDQAMAQLQDLYFQDVVKAGAGGSCVGLGEQMLPKRNRRFCVDRGWDLRHPIASDSTPAHAQDCDHPAVSPVPLGAFWE